MEEVLILVVMEDTLREESQGDSQGSEVPS